MLTSVARSGQRSTGETGLCPIITGPYITRLHLVMQSTGLCNFRVRASYFSRTAGILSSLARTYFIYIIYFISYGNNREYYDYIFYL